MEKIPHLLIEGMITSSYALGAKTSYIYIRGEYMYIVRILEKAIEEAYAAGFLGQNILGTIILARSICSPWCGSIHLW